MADEPRKYALGPDALNARVVAAIAGLALSGVAASQAQAAQVQTEVRTASPRQTKTSLKLMRSRLPGVSLRDLGSLASLVEYRVAPRGLTGPERKLLGAVVAHYRAGRATSAATSLRKLSGKLDGSGRSKLLPAVLGHIAYATAVATDRALEHTVIRYDFERRKRIAIDAEIAKLKHLKPPPSLKVEVTRWASAPGRSLIAATETKVLDPKGLQREIAYQTSQRELSVATMQLLDRMVARGVRKKAIRAATDRVRQAATAVEEAAEEVAPTAVEEAAEEVIGPVEEAVDDAIDEVQEAVDEVIGPVEEAVEAVEQAVEEAVDAVEGAIEEAVEDAAIDPVEAAVEEAAEAVEGAVSSGTIPQHENLYAGLDALAQKLLARCVERRDEAACRELTSLSQKIAVLLSKT